MFAHAVARQGRDNEGAVLGALANGASAAMFDRVRAAYAYASSGGVVLLVGALQGAMPTWEIATKQWLVSMDFGHTDPEALDYLASLVNSQVRVPFAAEVLARGLLPRTCFHPKTLILDRAAAPNDPPAMLAIGSANLTASGLRFGYEDVSVATWTRGPMSRAVGVHLAEMQAEAARFDRLWATSARPTAALMRQYVALRPKRRTREDASERVRDTEAGLTADYARIAEMLAASSLWVEIAYVTPNLGAGMPGNQVDLARGTRTFFGLRPDRVAPNTALGAIDITYGATTVSRNMRFGNNSMDKLDLPIPGVAGPATYTNSVLIFTRTVGGAFVLRLATPAEAVRLRAFSARAGTLFRMNSGRRWGLLP